MATKKTNTSSMTISEKAKMVKGILQNAERTAYNNAVVSLPKALFPEAETEGEEAVRRRQLEVGVQTNVPGFFSEVSDLVQKPYTTTNASKPSFKTRSMLDNFDPTKGYDVLTKEWDPLPANTKATPEQLEEAKKKIAAGEKVDTWRLNPTPRNNPTLDPEIANIGVSRVQQYIEAAKKALDEYEKSRPASYAQASQSGIYSDEELKALAGKDSKANILAQETWDRENRNSGENDTWDNVLSNMGAVSDDYLKYIRETVIPQNISAIEQNNAAIDRRIANATAADLYAGEAAGDRNRLMTETVTDIYQGKGTTAGNAAALRSVFGEDMTDAEVNAMVNDIKADPEAFLEKNLTDTQQYYDQWTKDERTPAYEQLSEDIAKEQRSREAYATLMSEAQSSPTYEQDKVFTPVDSGRATGTSADMSTLYMWLNDSDFRTKYDNANSMSMTQALDNPFWAKGYEYMTEEEVYGFNAAYAQSEEAAERYLSSLNATGVLNRRRAEAQVYSATNFTESSPLVAKGLTFGTNVITAVQSPYQLVAAATGYETDPNSSMYDINRFNTTVRGTINQMANEISPALGFVDDVLTSLGDNLIAVGISKGFVGAAGLSGEAANKWVTGMTQSIMSSNAASNSLYESLQAGDDQVTAVAKAIASGGIEALTEKYSIETLLSDPTSAWKHLAKNFLAEGSEEVASDLLNPIADAFISGITNNRSEIEREYNNYILQGYSKKEASDMVMNGFVKDLVYDFFAGGFAGGLGAGTFIAANAYQGSQLKNAGTVNGLKEIAATMPEDSKTRKYLNAVERTGSNYSTAQLYNTLHEELPSASQETLDKIVDVSMSQQLKDMGEEGDTGVIAGAIRKVVSNQKLTEEERSAITSSKAGLELMNKATSVSSRDSAEKRAYDKAYNAGFYGREIAEGMNQEYYQHGVQDAQAAEQRRLDLVGKGKAGTGSVRYIGTVLSDADIGTRNSMSINSNTLANMDTQQQEAVGAIQAIAKVVPSINFVLYEGQANDSGVIEVENGKYETTTNTLYIDLNSGKTRVGQSAVQYTIMQTVAHEMTHFIESNSTKGYATYRQLIKDTLAARGQNFDALVQHKLDVAEDNGISLTRDGAVAEVVADASEMMLKDTKAFQQLAAKDKSLAKNIGNFVKGLLSKIRKALGGVSAKHPEARALMEAEQYVAGLQEAWDAALVEAVETVESSKTEASAGAENMETVKGSETGETWNGIPVVEQFELREPVEKKGNLVATHAVSTQNLMNMLDEGTMVGLSLAVSHADSQASTKFGDNTLVFYASAIDPETNPDNHIFGFDAWTPRHPKAVYQKNEGAIQQTRNTYVKTMQDSGIDSRLVQQLGKFFDTHLEQQPADWIKTKNGNAQKVFNSPVSISGQNSGINALYLLENGVPAEQINAAYNENTRALIDMFQNNPQLMESLNQFKAKIASGFYEGRLFEQGITDTNDRAGSSLSDITVENTPDNALDIMKRQSLTDVGDSVGADGIRRKIPLVYKSLNEVRNDQGRLSINTNTTEEMLNAADSALAKFKNEVRIGKQSTAKIEGILQNAAANNLSDSDTVRALWKAGYIKANKKNVGEVMKAIQSFRNSPTNYFEAKLMRKSSFSEVAAAVVRESSTDLIARLKENGIRVLTYNGTVDDRIAKVNSVEEAKFSLRNPVETAGELVAVHNIKQNDLLATLRLGGFPMPSIAIVKGEEGHTMYGDYSVVFGKDTIDPQADKANKVYGADAWTPTFPPVETEIKHDVMYNVQQEMGSLAGQVDSEYAQKAKSWFGNFGGLDTTDKTMADIQDSAWNNSGMVAAYLADHGENVDILEKDVPIKRDYNPARASMYDKVLDIVPLSDIESMKARDLLDTYGDQLAESIPHPFARLNTLWKDKDYDAGKRMLDFLRQAKFYENSGRDTSVQTEKAKDYDATYTAMKESIDRNDFNAWVAQKMQGTFGAQGIYNGKERFTPSGNRRNFKSLHNDLTVDNVVKSMLTQEESYIPPTDAKGLMAAASRMYKSIAEIKDDASRLGKISGEEYIAKVAHADNMYHDFLNAIEAWDANEIEDVGELLVKAAKQQMNASAISTLFKRNGYSKATLNASKMAKQLIDTVQNIPTGYFEAKPRRVVDFNEIRMVIAPDTMGSELENALTERNIPYTTYAANDEADRLAKLNSLEDVKFSLREVDNKQVVWIDENILENKPAEMSDKKFIKNYLIEHIDDVYTIIESGSKVYPYKRLPTEYLYSKDAQKLERFDRSKFKTKLQMVSGIGEMIEIATNRRWEKVRHSHNKNSRYGVYRYDTQVAFNNKGTPQAYTTELVILNADNGKKYLYDVVNIQKDDVTAKRLMVKARGAKNFAQQTNTVSTSIHESGEFDNPYGEIFSLREETEDDLTDDYLMNMSSADVETDADRLFLNRYQYKRASYAKSVEALNTAVDKLNSGDLQGDALIRQQNRVKILQERVNRAKDELRMLEDNAGTRKLRDSVAGFVRENLVGRTDEEIAQLVADAEAEVDRLIKMTDSTDKDVIEAQKRLKKLKSTATQKVIDAKVIRELSRKSAAAERRITTTIKKLNNMLLHETDYKNVPEELKGFVADVVKTFGIDFNGMVFSKKQAESLVSIYDHLQKNDSSFMQSMYNEDIAEMMSDLVEYADMYQNIRLGTVTDENGNALDRLERAKLRNFIVESASDIVNFTDTMVKNSTEMRVNGRKQKFATIANNAMAEMNERPDRLRYQNKLGDASDWMEQLIVTGNMTPVYFFDKLGNHEFKRLFDDFLTGQERWAFVSKASQQRIQEIMQEYKYDTWKDADALTFTTQQGNEITLDKEQAMWLYATWKREHSNPLAATEHLTKGGFVYEGNKGTAVKKTMLGTKAAEKTTGNLISEEDMKVVNQYLDEQQKGYADSMVNFISKDIGALGNEVSMELFGIRKYKENYYFPYAVSRDHLYQKSSAGGGATTDDSRIKHSSFTHALTKGAQTPLVLGNFTDVVANHIGQMATYYGMTLPIENMNRVLNYKYKADNGSSVTMRSLIRQKYGSNTLVYMERLLRDANGGIRASDKSPMQKFVSLFKKSAVVASASVSLQQTSAMLRAGAMMNFKYLLQTPANYKAEYNELMKHSGVAIVKQMGRFDTNVGQSYTDWLLAPDDANLKLWGKVRQAFGAEGKEALKNRWESVVTGLPNTMDEVAWGMLWKAVKTEQADLHPDMDVKSEAFLDMCGERFNDIANHTQVYDSVLSRSQLMRSTNAINQMATAFRAEPTLTLNVLYDAFFNKNIPKEQRASRRASAVFAVLTSSMAAAIGSAMISAWGDDDDKRTAAEKFIRKTNENFFDNIMPLYNIPYISDIVSIFEGYDVERADMSLFADLVNSFNKINSWRKGNTTLYRAMEEFIGTLANFAGIPVKNLMRDARRVYNMATSRWEKPTKTGMTAALMPDASIPGWEYDTSAKAYCNRLVSAYMKGDNVKAKDIETYMQTVLDKDAEYIRDNVKKAVADRFEAGSMTEEEGTNLLYKLYKDEKGFDKDSLYFYFDKLKDKMSGKLGKDDTYSKYNDFYTAVETGKGLRPAISELESHGSSKDDIAGAITRKYSPIYVSLYKTNKREASNLLSRLLTAYEELGYDRDKKLKDIQRWIENDEKKNGTK